MHVLPRVLLSLPLAWLHIQITATEHNINFCCQEAMLVFLNVLAKPYLSIVYN